jgi:predicted amidohydrolase YtcJ
MEVMRDWTTRKHKGHWQSIRGQQQEKGFKKKLFARKARKLLNLSRNQPIILTKLITGHWIKRSPI